MQQIGCREEEMATHEPEESHIPIGLALRIEDFAVPSVVPSVLRRDGLGGSVHERREARAERGPSVWLGVGGRAWRSRCSCARDLSPAHCLTFEVGFVILGEHPHGFVHISSLSSRKVLFESVEMERHAAIGNRAQVRRGSYLSLLFVEQPSPCRGDLRSAGHS